jgi:hypothetical protein
MTEPGRKLQRNADELLCDFPMIEPDFEAQANAISARLSAPSVAGALSLPDEDLLKAPELAAESGEPPLPSQVRAAPPKSSFAEMARKSVQKKEDDAASLAKELLAAAQTRRPNAELVERVRAAGRSAPTAPPLPASEPRRERNSGVVTRAEAAPLPPAAVGAAPATTAAMPSRDSRGTIIGMAGVAVAIAACLALYLKSGPSVSPGSAALEAQRAADAPVAAAGPKPAAPAVAATNERQEGVLSPEALQRVPEAHAADGARPALIKAGGGAIAPASKAASAAASSAAKQEAVVLDDDPAPAQAEPKPEPAPEPVLKPAEGNSGSVPLSPSAGAVSTALSSVRSGAQACLAGQSEAVTATVTFASDGHVLRVSAAGPSGACIQAALSRAHVAPFAKESFSATTTVRPP